MRNYCSYECGTQLALANLEKKKRKDWAGEKKRMKDGLMSTQKWLQLLQKEFNTWIRERDRDLPCISCGRQNNVQYHAGHLMTVGAYPNLRFDEDNVHKQCVHCNKELHGNILEYRERLIDRIGEERFRALEARKNEPLHITLPEIKEKIQHYRKLVKQLKQQQ